MKVGLLTLCYRLYGRESIKERRSIVRRLIAQVHAQGPAFAVCVIDPGGGLQRAGLRIAHLSEDAARTTTALAHLQEKLERGNGYEVFDAA
ncbi:MAG: DUF503 family protein, partial [Candidatus Bipolaricaulota bacterium]|nr:DUF503 family protein [Candidatus Bipolaricaulota bacterium]